MKRVLTIAGRDLKSGLRDFLVVYLMFAPFLLAFLLRLFVGGVGATPLTVAVYEDGVTLAARLSDYAQVEIHTSRTSLHERVGRIDDMIGIVATEHGYEIVQQGNESPGIDSALRSLLHRFEAVDVQLPVTVSVRALGWQMSPLKLAGGLMLILFTTVFGGMMILLSIIEEKMSNTISAMNVSPATKIEFILGKGALGFLTPIVGSMGAVTILGFYGYNFAMFLVSIISLASISLVIGFVIGVMNSDPISGIASMKAVFLPVLASMLGAMFLAPEWHFVLYWSPFYWGYQGMSAILLGEATWGQVVHFNSLILAITALVFLFLRPRIVRGLN